ncbi:hypothetical protein [Atlantibacter hermannii]|uniref:hypothetical protein n=1 Tax=Atlantibacter hermannii TaxID=565 RepID=UPI0028ADCF40|nr:hypothetical protein [Atlantibacter hermannii]
MKGSRQQKGRKCDVAERGLPAIAGPNLSDNHLAMGRQDERLQAYTLNWRYCAPVRIHVDRPLLAHSGHARLTTD